MPDGQFRELHPTAELPKHAEPTSTIDATAASASTFGRDVRHVGDPTAPTIAGYAITGEIARGGMGKVYAAKDLTLDREVAIKTLLPGAPADRFVTESKITARLPHPGIPPVHAMGWLDDNTPYLVMKLIRGRTSAALLEERSSPTADLSKFVAVFEQIAQAVGFAHEQGIIHRDLKPLNVMVGAFGEVQVMDWGLAKDLSISREAQPSASNDIDDANLTSAGAIMGTPGYMAPEQARGESADARADVFALGAILAAILTGKPAFVGTTARETIKKAARGDLSETLERLVSSGVDAEIVALATDCLAAEPSARPADAKQVALRVADFRVGVEQRLKQAETAKTEALVREAEQSKRRLVMQWAAGIITSALLAGVVGTSLGMKEARRQEGFARFEAGEKDKALKESQANLAFAKKGNEILGSVFAGLDPKRIAESGRPLQDVLRENLAHAVNELEGNAIGDPLEVAAMQNSLAYSLAGLGDYKPAIVLFEKARDTRSSRLAADDPDLLLSMHNLAFAYQQDGNVAKATPLFEAAFKSREAKLGPFHPDTIQSMNSLGGAYETAGRLDLALPLFEKSLKLSKEHLGLEHPVTLICMNNMADGYQSAGKVLLALPILESMLDYRKAKHGVDHPTTLSCMGNLAAAYHEVGKRDQAMPLYEEAFRRRRASLGPDHPETLIGMNNLAMARQVAGETDVAASMFEELVRLSKIKLGVDHPDTLIRLSNLAYCHQAAGNREQALPIQEEVLKLRKAKLGVDHPSTLLSMGNLALTYRALGKLELAVSMTEETFKLTEAKFGRDHPSTLLCLNNLASAYQSAGGMDRAIKMFEENVQRSKGKLGADHPDTILRMSNLAFGYQTMGDLERALPIFEEAAVAVEKRQFQHEKASLIIDNAATAYDLARRFDQAWTWRRKWLDAVKNQKGESSSTFAVELSAIGDKLVRQRRWLEAQPVLEKSLAIRDKMRSEHWSTYSCRSLLGATLLGQKKYSEAEPLLLNGSEGLRRQEKSMSKESKSRLAEALDRLVELYTATNKPDEVRKWKAERAKYPVESKTAAAPVKNPPNKK